MLLYTLSLEEELLLVGFMISDVWFCFQSWVSLKQHLNRLPLWVSWEPCAWGWITLSSIKLFAHLHAAHVHVFNPPDWVFQGQDLFLIGHHYSQCLTQCLIYRMDSVNVDDYNELVWNYSGKRCDLLWFRHVQCIISLKAHSSLMKQVSHQVVITIEELRIWSSER